MKFKIKDRTNFYSKDNIHLKYYKTMSLKKKKKSREISVQLLLKYIYIYKKLLIFLPFFKQNSFIAPFSGVPPQMSLPLS